jgi:DegV family protein with EDD domain
MRPLHTHRKRVCTPRKRVRVHIHVNNPAEVFLACEEFGEIKQQKADDMQRQHGLLDHAGEVAIVTDSGADIPADEAERLSIHTVPVRLSFGDREYLDGVSLSSEAFYTLLSEEDEPPLTSQPPAQDFSRVYSLLTTHGYAVISVGLSEQLSGTTAAARQAAGRPDAGDVRVIDSLNVTAGQGLLAMAAAEAAIEGSSAEEVEAFLRDLIPRTRVFAVADDLSYAVKGGRVPSWVKRVADFLHLNPVLTANPEGKIGLNGFHIGSGANPSKLARTAVSKMEPETMYRVLVAHANNQSGAIETRHHILEQHGRVHSCHITEAGPALGVHIGPGGLIVGIAPQSIIR